MKPTSIRPAAVPHLCGCPAHWQATSASAATTATTTARKFSGRNRCVVGRALDSLARRLSIGASRRWPDAGSQRLPCSDVLRARAARGSRGAVCPASDAFSDEVGIELHNGRPRCRIARGAVCQAEVMSASKSPTNRPPLNNAALEEAHGAVRTAEGEDSTKSAVGAKCSRPNGEKGLEVPPARPPCFRRVPVVEVKLSRSETFGERGRRGGVPCCATRGTQVCSRVRRQRS